MMRVIANLVLLAALLTTLVVSSNSLYAGGGSGGCKWSNGQCVSTGCHSYCLLVGGNKGGGGNPCACAQ